MFLYFFVSDLSFLSIIQKVKSSNKPQDIKMATPLGIGEDTDTVANQKVSADAEKGKNTDLDREEYRYYDGGRNNIEIPKLDDFKSYEDFEECVEMWSATTDLALRKQGPALFMEIPKNSVRFNIDDLRGDLQRNVKLKNITNNQNGVTLIMDYLKTRLQKDPILQEIKTLRDFTRWDRPAGQDFADYIREFDMRMQKAKDLGMEFTDNCLAFMLLIAGRIEDRDLKVIYGTVEFKANRGKLYERIKTKLKEMLTNSLTEITPKEESAFVSESLTEEQQEVLMARGWKPPSKKNYNSKWNNNKNKSNGNHEYKKPYSGGGFQEERKTNPVGANGKILECRACKSILHLLKDCPHSFENQNGQNKGYKKNIMKAGKKRFQKVLMVEKGSDEKQEVYLELSDTDSEKTETDSESAYCVNLYTADKDELSRFTAETINYGALDTCCTSTVAGEKWMSIYLNSLPKQMKEKLQGPLESKRNFMFGNQGTLKSKGRYKLPVRIGGEMNILEVDIINSDIPLLISKSDMKKLGIALDLAEDKGSIMGKPLILETTSAGHYIVDLIHNDDIILSEAHIVDLDTADEKTQMKALRKIHSQFGHQRKRAFIDLLKGAGKWKESFAVMIDKIVDNCEGCLMRRRNPDRPVVALPIGKDFNEAIAMDLKIWDMNNNIYILYIMDTFTRFIAAVIIRRKQPEEVVNALLMKWVQVFGTPALILTDNGGEFKNEEIRAVAAKFNIRTDTTGAESPWQNGTMEKGHYTVDVMTRAVKRDHPGIKLEIALAWACTAKNSMNNVWGFSSHQLVFGRNIRLPDILNDPPASWDNNNPGKSFKDIVDAIYATREAFTKKDRCERLKRALKSKIRTNLTVFQQGDNVYFKRELEEFWRGPARVVYQDGKVLSLVQNGVGYKASVNRVLKVGQEFNKEDNETVEETIKQKNEQDSGNITVPDSPTVPEKTKTTTIDNDNIPYKRKLRSKQSVIPSNTNNDQTENSIGHDGENSEFMSEKEKHTTNVETETDNESTAEQRIENHDNENEVQELATEGESTNSQRKRKRKVYTKDDYGNLINAGMQVVRRDRIEIKEKGKWEPATVIDRAGKRKGPYEGWFNIQLDSGRVFNDDLNNREIRIFDEDSDPKRTRTENEEALWTIALDNGVIIEDNLNMRQVRLMNDSDTLASWIDEEVLAVMVPRERRDSPEAMEAKHKELEKLQEFETYKVVDDIGQDRITTTWVLTEKGDEVRARLTAKGFQEEEEFPKDSPTLQKHSLRIILMLAVSLSWIIETTDIKSAFLQGSRLERTIHVKPPKEANQVGKLWKLLKCLYGLKDASRQWYLKVKGKLKEMGFKKSSHDGALFYLIKDGSLQGFIGLHVDDFLHSGSKYFNTVIMPQILSLFKVGKAEVGEFVYTGFKMKQTPDSITLDQNDYVKDIDIPKLDAKRLLMKDDEMTQDELTILRKLTGILNWAVRATTPEFSFDLIEQSTHFKGGKVQHLAHAQKTLTKLKQANAFIKISAIKDLANAQIWMYCDAAFRNLNDKTDSCGGYIVFVIDTKSGLCAPLDWKSNKIKRKVNSTLGAETLTLVWGLDAAIGIRKQLKELTQGEIDLPIKAITDNRSARTAVYSESEVTERELRADIAMVKEKIEEKMVTEIKWIRGKHMIADILTKKGVDRLPILQVLQEGRVSAEDLALIN